MITCCRLNDCVGRRLYEPWLKIKRVNGMLYHDWSVAMSSCSINQNIGGGQLLSSCQALKLSVSRWGRKGGCSSKGDLPAASTPCPILFLLGSTWEGRLPSSLSKRHICAEFYLPTLNTLQWRGCWGRSSCVEDQAAADFFSQPRYGLVWKGGVCPPPAVKGISEPNSTCLWWIIPCGEEASEAEAPA